MKIIKGIKVLFWLIQHNERNEYDKLIDSLFEDLNYSIDLLLYHRGYKKS